MTLRVLLCRISYKEKENSKAHAPKFQRPEGGGVE